MVWRRTCSCTGSLDRHAAGLLAGVIFAFSPYRFEHFDHLEMQLSFWIPLAVLAWHRAVERQTTRACLMVSALVAAQVFSCIYYGVFLITSLATMTAFWFWRTPMKAVRAGTLMLLPAMVAFAIYSLPYLGNRERVGDRPAGEIAGYSAELTDFVSAPRTNRLYGWTDSFGAPERHLFPGLVAVSLLVVGLWPPLDRQRAIHAGSTGPCLPARPRIERLDLRFALRVGAAVSRPACAGAGRHSRRPGHGGARRVRHGPARKTPGRRRGAPAVLALVVGLASLEYRSKPALQDVDQRVSPWYTMLGTLPDAVVFEWPVTVPWRIWNMVDVDVTCIDPRSTGAPLLNGYSGFDPSRTSTCWTKCAPSPTT